ncbi:MAG: hypothetical protein WCF18_12180 [Chthoniobacteraceae bacterium]
MKAASFALLLSICQTSAQYLVDWSTMDAGAGSGSAGAFAMEATLGQPDAAFGAAGSFAFFGGYWSLPEEPLPLLRIFRVDADVVLAWPYPSTGFLLQTSPELLPPAWLDVATPPVTVGPENQVTWGPASVRRFFRLHRP